MPKNICVLKPAVVIDGLSYKRAKELLEKASNLEAAKYLTFSIFTSGEKQKSKKVKPIEHLNCWSLQYLPKQAGEKFRENPDGFILEV